MAKRNRKRFICLGAGGHGRSVAEVIAAQDEYECAGYLDADPKLAGRSIHGFPVLGGDPLLAEVKKQGITHFLVTIGTAGEPDRWQVRARKFEEAIGRGLVPVTLVHPRAIVSGYSTVSSGVVVMPGAIVAAGARVGDNVILNSGCIVEHDCVIGPHCHLASGAVLGGCVELGEGVHVGAGAVVRQLLKIGRGAVIGAGAVVVGDVAAGTPVVGVPARPIRSPR
jgi:UDP-perosamine 4-acetyltransferase